MRAENIVCFAKEWSESPTGTRNARSMVPIARRLIVSAGAG